MRTIIGPLCVFGPSPPDQDKSHSSMDRIHDVLILPGETVIKKTPRLQVLNNIFNKPGKYTLMSEGMKGRQHCVDGTATPR